MPVTATRLVRKMRGGAQAHLLECDDGGFYVVKFRNNPQHRRVLVNEWISSVFLKYLHVATPDTAVVNLTPEFLDGNADLSMMLGSRTVRPEAGWHFGSRFPGDPNRLAVYDFLPDVLLGKVENPADFPAILAFDKWVGNCDSRQAIFFRARLRPPVYEPDAAPRVGFLALMVDNGYTFDGPHWTFPDSPLQGLYHRSAVYRAVRSLDDFQPWLERIVSFPEDVIDDALRRTPPQWIAQDDGALHNLMEQLVRRRRRVPDLILDAARSRFGLFANWEG